MSRRLLVLAALWAASACPASHKYMRSARDLFAYVEGKSVFGPTNEWMASPIPQVAATGLFPVRPPDQCEVAIIAGGEDSFAIRMALLKRATKTIRIQALIFTGDESGLRIAEVLKQKKAAGVDVKIVVDSVNNAGWQTQWMYFDLKQHGIEVEGYEALGLQLFNEWPIPLTRGYYDSSHPNRRYHEKLWIIDAGTPNAEAVMGGLNIANEYFRVDPTNVPRYWRDQDIVVRGTILEDLTLTFDRNFAHFKELKEQRGILTDTVWEATRAIMEKTGRPKIDFDRSQTRIATVAELEARTPPIRYLGAQCRFLQSRPRLQERYIEQAYMKLFSTAKKEVVVGNAYFVPTPSTRLMVAQAAKRCVRVVLLSNGAETNDTPGISAMGRSYYSELLAVNQTAAVKACPQPAGVEIWEWMGKKAGDAKQTQGLYHAKYAIVDRTISLVGSYNLDPRSERHNSETALVFEQPELAAELMRLYEEDLATSRRISEKEAASFENPEGTRAKLTKSVAWMFEDLM